MARTRLPLLIAVLVAAFAVTGSPSPAGAEASDAPTGPATFRSISTGQFLSCAIRSNGSARCWGRNSEGQLGQGSITTLGDGPGEMGSNLPPIDLGTGRTATTVSAGTNHACAVLDNGSVKCWGRNGEGQLGLGDVDSRGNGPEEMGDALPAVDLGTGRTAITVVAAGSSTCALLDNATVKCWGQNPSGVLGQGDVLNRGDGAGEMGDNLPAVALGTGRTATAISSSGSSTCAILDNGTVKCWGSGLLGRLGYGDTANRGDGAGEMGDSLPAVALGTGRTATAISVGSFNACAILDDSTVKCWGGSANGELGLGTTDNRGDGAGEMGDSLPAVALGTGRTAAGVSVGTNYTCVLLDNGTVKCWGTGGAGRLGLGDTSSRGDGAGEMGDDLPSVALGTGRTATAVTTGNGQTCALLDNAGLKCWGPNSFGELGLGDNDTRGDGAGEMGDDLPTVDLGGPVGPVAPFAALTVTKVADQATVAEGSAIDYHVTVTNSGTLPLTGVTVTDPNAPDCDTTIGALAVAEVEVVDCSYTTSRADVGTRVNIATADSDQTDPVESDEVSTVVDGHQPDGLVRVGNGPYRGDGVYNTTATGQGRAANVGNLGVGTFRVRVQNDGTATDDIRLQGLGSTNRFVVTYKRGTANITAGVVAGTFTLEDVPAGGTRDVVLRIQAKAGTPVNATLARKVTLTSVTTGAQDAVKATVTRR